MVGEYHNMDLMDNNSDRLFRTGKPLFHNSTIMLLTASALGAFCGAFAAQLADTEAIFKGVSVPVLTWDGLLRVLSFALLPLALFLSDFLRSRLCFFFTFFVKSLLTVYLLCTVSNFFPNRMAVATVRAVFFHCVLLLPIYFYTALQMMNTVQNEQRKSWTALILINAIAALTAAFLEKAFS